MTIDKFLKDFLFLNWNIKTMMSLDKLTQWKGVYGMAITCFKAPWKQFFASEMSSFFQ